jgi:hypothetical protein
MTENKHLLRTAKGLPSRLDLYAFIAAFGSGLVLYMVLQFVFHTNKLLITALIVLIMLTYAFFIWRIPRLRVRLDQAGDNAYYLGLLFTLVSMATALYDFWTATSNEIGTSVMGSGPEHILGSFGIALASTITGIFLRVLLHQMRIDPADVEGMTRIELAEASRKVQASIDTVTNDLGRFHDEIRQKADDYYTSLVEDASRTVTSLGKKVEHAANEMITSAGNTQKTVLEQIEGLTKLLRDTASEATGAIERLRAVEQPPVTLARRFEKVAKTLDTTNEQTERLSVALQGTADSAKVAVEGISQAAADLRRIAEQMASNQAAEDVRLSASANSVITSLGSVSMRLERDRQLINKIEEETTRFANESTRAQTAAVEVLKTLTEVTRGVTSALNHAATINADGTAE